MIALNCSDLDGLIMGASKNLALDFFRDIFREKAAMFAFTSREIYRRHTFSFPASLRVQQPRGKTSLLFEVSFPETMFFELRMLIVCKKDKTRPSGY